jgi:hypothetical protein
MTSFIHATFFTFLTLPTLVWLFVGLFGSFLTKENRVQWLATLTLYSLLYYYTTTYYNIEVLRWDWF